MTNLEKIYDFISKVNNGENIEFTRKYKINGVGYGSKHVNGEDQTKSSLIFYVNNKRAIDSMKIEEIIPRFIDIEGIRLETDVQISQINHTLIQNCFPDNGTNFPLSANYRRRRPLQGGMSSIFGPGKTMDEAVFSVNNDNSDATLGILVRDKTDGSIVALSNNHVFAKSSKMPAQFFNWYIGNDMLSHNMFPNTNVTDLSVKNPGRKKGINAYSTTAATRSFNNQYNYPWDRIRGKAQFGSYGSDGIQTGFKNKILSAGESNPYGTSDTQYGDVIGRTKRAITFGERSGGFINSNQGGTIYGSAQGSVDAAIASLSSYDLIDSSVSNQIINFSEPGPYTFATKEEVLSLFEVGNVNYGAPVFRSGRRMGPVGNVNGSGQTVSCYLVDSASSLSATGKLSAYQYAPAYVSDGLSITYFPDSIWVRGDSTTKPGGGGDSGSAVFACLSSTVNSASAWKMIGLLYAGPSDQTSTIISPIHEVVNKLKIAPWDGTIPTLTATTDTFTLSDDIFSGESGTSYQSQSLTAEKFGQMYTLIETVVGDRKPTSENPYGSNKLGPEPYQGQSASWSEYKFSRPDGRVVVMSPNFYHQNLNINNHDIFNTVLKIDTHYLEGLTRAGGGIIYEPQDDGSLKATSRVNTPYLSVTPYLANDIAEFNGKMYYNNTANIDYSIKAQYNHTVYGNLTGINQSNSSRSAYFSASHLPGTDEGGGGAPAGGWGKFRQNSTRPSTDYAYEGLKSVANTPFRHQKLGLTNISDTDFLFSVHKPIKTTYGWASTGFACSAVYETFEKFGNYQVWANQSNSMFVPSSPTTEIPLPISDPIDIENTKGGVMVFDDNMNFIQNIKPRLTLDVNNYAYPNSIQKKRTKKYLDTNGNTVTYGDNVNLGPDTLVDQFSNMHYDDGLTTLSGGKLLAFTGKHYLSLGESGAQKNEYVYFVETHKYDENTKQFTFNQIVSGIMPCTWPRGGTAAISDSKLGNRDFSIQGGFFEPRINNITLADNKLYVNLHMTGPYNLGMMHVFTKDNNDQFTLSNILSAPCLSGAGNGFDGLAGKPLSSYQANERAFSQVQEFGDYIVSTGLGFQYKGNHIEGGPGLTVGLGNQDTNIRNWDITSPNAWPSAPIQPGLSARMYDYDPIWLINKNTHTLAGCLSTPIVEIHKTFNTNDLDSMVNTSVDGITGSNPTGQKKYSINYMTSDPNEIYIGPSDTQQNQIFNFMPTSSRTQIIRREAHAGKNKLLVGYTYSTFIMGLSDYMSAIQDFSNPTEVFRMPNAVGGALRGANRSVAFIDMYENINGYPTLTKRLSSVVGLGRTYKETYAGTSDYYTDFESGLNLGSSFMNGNCYDDNYFYYWSNGLVGQNKQLDDTFFEEGKAGVITQAGFGRVRLDDVNYFKPISAYDDKKRYDGGFNPRYNQDINVPLNSTAFGISGGPSDANTKYSWMNGAFGGYKNGYGNATSGYTNSPE